MERTKLKIIFSDDITGKTQTRKLNNTANNAIGAKGTPTNTTTTAGIIKATKPFEVIGIDFIGPMQQSDGYKYLVVAMDYFTRWPMVRKTKTATVEDFTSFIDPIYQSRGPVNMIVANNGGAFKGNKLTEFLEAANITILETSAYSPKTNAMVERLNKNIIERLQK